MLESFVMGAVLSVTAVSSVAAILGAMTLVAIIEVLVPLHARGPWHRAHLRPNLGLTLLTLATNLFLNAGLVALVAYLEAKQVGLLHWFSVPEGVAGVIAVAALDFAFYAAHLSWHKIPPLWAVHAVHHSDPAVDVTTTIRQHPVEGVMRYAAMTAMAIAVGPSPKAFAVYRVASALNGLLEHANFRAPLWLDRILSYITTWPHMHKVHHSRIPAETDTNYGNLFSFWDRIFGTYTPSHHGRAVRFGLEGIDEPELQTFRGLLRMPFCRATRRGLDSSRDPVHGTARTS
jgi:sterol desaturase/sphingolipid hydroxylase (fatty acid hydroxylase superfamily)